MTESRLTELETKLAFAEDLIDALNQTVIRQQQSYQQESDAEKQQQPPSHTCNNNQPFFH